MSQTFHILVVVNFTLAHITQYSIELKTHFQCSYKCDTPLKLNEHKQACHPKIQCDLCSKEYKTHQGLKKHITTIHGGKAAEKHDDEIPMDGKRLSYVVDGDYEDSFTNGSEASV